MQNFAIPAPEVEAWLDNGVRSYRVRVRRPEEVAWTNLSDILGGDWVVGVQADGETPDSPANRFAIRFLKHATEGSVSPGISASPLNIDAALEFRPLLHPGRSVEMDVRVNAEPWRLWLQGEIEDVEWADDDVTASCLTLDGVLVAAQVEAVEQRGLPDPGTPMQAEIQGLLDRWMGDTAPTLRTIGDPAAGVGVYSPALGGLGNQARELAQTIAWDLRYRWSEADSNYRLTLYLPPRDRVTVDLALSADIAVGVLGLKQSRQYVRNAFPISFVNAAGAIEWVDPEVTDPDSITEYRRRAMPINEGSDSPIRTEAQAIALAEYAKNDLSRPLVDGRYEIPFLPFLELHDVLVIQADDDHFDYDTTFAVVGVSHRIDPEGGAWTEVDLRGGTPVGQFYSWHKRRAPDPLPDSRYGLNNFTRRYTATEMQSAWEPGAMVAEVWISDVLYAVEAMPVDPYPGEGDLSDYQVLTVGVDPMEYAALIPPFGFVRCLQFEARTASLGFGPGDGTIIRFEVQPNQVGTEGIEDDAVTTPKVADLAVVSAKLADAAVIRAKILDGAVNDLKLADLAVTNAKVATDAISTDKLVALAVTAAKIGAAAVEEAKLAAGAVTEAKIGAAAVTTAKLANLAVTDAILAAAAVTNTKIADNSISTPKLQAGSVTAAVIAAGTITSNEIAANTIVAGDIAAGTITGTEIAAATITGAKLVALTITSAQIQAGTITGVQIQAGTISANEIAAATITGAKIAALTIEGGNIAAATIAAGKLVANTITANEIASNAITSDKINAGAVTADKISVGALSAITATLGSVEIDTPGNGADITLKTSGSTIGRIYSSTVAVLIDAASAGQDPTMALFDSSGSGVIRLLADEIRIDGTLSLNSVAVSLGAADSGGSGFRVLRVPN